MPDFPIVDSHVHLYDPGLFRYSWMQGKPVYDGPHELAEFDRARGPVEVEAIVFVEVGADPGQYLQEASYIAGLADRDPRLKGMVAAAPLERGAAVTPDLEKLASHDLTRSIRRLIEIESEPGFCLRPGFVEGVRLLPRFDLAFDLCVKHWQLADAIELVRQCPEVRIVLDHIGKPPIRDGGMEPWRTHIKELAALSNVWCKLSGVITEADHEHWTRDQLRPYLDHVIDGFGFDRLMYGSDWPVSEQTHRYPDWVAILDWVTAGCSGVEVRKLFRDTAIAFYRLDRPSGGAIR
jgi:predicted TIM-barrel fold metal-dependent hydrolase